MALRANDRAFGTNHRVLARVLAERASHRRAAAAADAERRRIERDIHDGAQQRLLAIRMELGLLEERLGRDSDERAMNLLADVRRELDEALEELRRLAQGIYPALLGTDGLAVALAAAARRSPIPARVSASEIGRVPRPIEGAVYFCCLEALQNAAKHAGPGARVTVELRRVDGRLRFWVSDDGAGFDQARARPGRGLVNLRDRVASIGGTVSVISAPGKGTTVTGEIPVR